MPKLDFTPLDNEEAEEARRATARRGGRNPTMQMSLRMKESVYARFQQHARTYRFTNGEMLEEMMDAWERKQKNRG